MLGGEVLGALAAGGDGVLDRDEEAIAFGEERVVRGALGAEGGLVLLGDRERGLDPGAELLGIAARAGDGAAKRGEGRPRR